MNIVGMLIYVGVMLVGSHVWNAVRILHLRKASRACKLKP